MADTWHKKYGSIESYPGAIKEEDSEIIHVALRDVDINLLPDNARRLIKKLYFVTTDPDTILGDTAAGSYTPISSESYKQLLEEYKKNSVYSSDRDLHVIKSYVDKVLLSRFYGPCDDCVRVFYTDGGSYRYFNKSFDMGNARFILNNQLHANLWSKGINGALRAVFRNVCTAHTRHFSDLMHSDEKIIYSVFQLNFNICTAKDTAAVERVYKADPDTLFVTSDALRRHEIYKFSSEHSLSDILPDLNIICKRKRRYTKRKRRNPDKKYLYELAGDELLKEVTAQGHLIPEDVGRIFILSMKSILKLLSDNMQFMWQYHIVNCEKYHYYNKLLYAGYNLKDYKYHNYRSRSNTFNKKLNTEVYRNIYFGMFKFIDNVWHTVKWARRVKEVRALSGVRDAIKEYKEHEEVFINFAKKSAVAAEYVNKLQNVLILFGAKNIEPVEIPQEPANEQ